MREPSQGEALATWGIPSVLLPAAEPVWLLLVGLAIVSTVVLLREGKRTSYSAA